MKLDETDELMNESDEYLLQLTDELNKELANITVSDELINRTLNKIDSENKQHKSNSAPEFNFHKLDEQEQSNVVSINDAKASTLSRRYRWMKGIASVAGVAAACFLLVVGFEALRGFGGSKSSETSMDNGKESAILQSNETNDKYFAAAEQESKSEGALQTPMEPDVTDSTTMTEEGKGNGLTPAQLAKEQVCMEAEPGRKVYVYQSGTDEETCVQLLKLFQEDTLQLVDTEETDDWDYFIILSVDDETAIVYKVGRSSFVLVQTYDNSGKQSDVYYKVNDMSQLHEAIDLIVNQ